MAEKTSGTFLTCTMVWGWKDKGQLVGIRVRINSNTSWVRTLWVSSSSWWRFFGIDSFDSPDIIMSPPPKGRGHYKLPSVVCLSVRLSVCGVPRHNSRTERPRKPKIGRMQARHTGIQWTYLCQKVKGQGRKVTSWCIWQVLVDKSRTACYVSRLCNIFWIITNYCDKWNAALLQVHHWCAFCPRDTCAAHWHSFSHKTAQCRLLTLTNVSWYTHTHSLRITIITSTLLLGILVYCWRRFQI